jgi:hypothetical protein
MRGKMTPLRAIKDYCAWHCPLRMGCPPMGGCVLLDYCNGHDPARKGIGRKSGPTAPRSVSPSQTTGGASGVESMRMTRPTIEIPCPSESGRGLAKARWGRKAPCRKS